MIWLLTAILVWLGCGYVGGGILYTYSQKEFSSIAAESRTEDYVFSLSMGLVGPLLLLVSLLYKKHGICWNWITKPDLAAPTIPAVTLDVAAMTAYFKNGTPGNFLKQIGAAFPGLIVSENSADLPKSTSTEPVVGYRVWLLDREKGLLKSTYMTDYIWPARRRLTSDSFDHRGIHAVKEIRRLHETHLNPPSMYDPTGQDHQSLWDEYKADVAGEVYLWGEVKEHSGGYTAQYAYPKRLWMPEETDPCTVMKLEENYGVEVELRKEFKKHQPVDELKFPTMQTFYFSPGAIYRYSGSMGFAITPFSCAKCCAAHWDPTRVLCDSCSPTIPAPPSGPAPTSQAIVPYTPPKP